MLLAAALLVSVLRCAPSDDVTVIARETPPAWPISPYNSTWIDGVEYYQPVILPPRPMLALEFVNEDRRTITSIRFALYVDNVLIAQATDAGRFSPGARIAHELKLEKSLQIPPGTARCEPQEVRFDDGSAWRYSKTRLKSARSEAK